MALALVFVVQDTDSGQFMCPYEGDVSYTKFLRDAGRFHDPESAYETAQFHLGPNYIVSQFWEHETSDT